jgi:hypothetical protein
MKRKARPDQKNLNMTQVRHVRQTLTGPGEYAGPVLIARSEKHNSDANAVSTTGWGGQGLHVREMSGQTDRTEPGRVLLAASHVTAVLSNKPWVEGIGPGSYADGISATSANTKSKNMSWMNRGFGYAKYNIERGAAVGIPKTDETPGPGAVSFSLHHAPRKTIDFFIIPNAERFLTIVSFDVLSLVFSSFFFLVYDSPALQRK